jgi:hypothetical protein
MELPPVQKTVNANDFAGKNSVSNALMTNLLVLRRAFSGAADLRKGRVAALLARGPLVQKFMAPPAIAASCADGTRVPPLSRPLGKSADSLPDRRHVPHLSHIENQAALPVSGRQNCLQQM